MSVVIDSYSEANQDGNTTLNTLHPSATASLSAASQSFSMLSTNHKITSAKFYLRKGGSPTGLAHAVLYAHSGTFGSSSVPTGSALATSNDFDVSTLTLDFVLYELLFPSAQQYEMQANTKYCIVFENPISGTIDGTNHVRVGWDITSPAHAGNTGIYHDSAWAIATRDLAFYVYGEPVAAVAGLLPRYISSFNLRRKLKYGSRL